MKILIVCNQFYPAVGGVETHILNLAKRFVKDGDIVEVVSSISVDGRKSGKINGVFYKKFYSFKLFGIDAATIAPSLPIFLFKNISNYDIVHVHSYGYFVSWVTILISKVKKKKVIYTPHYADETTLPKIIKTIYDFCFAGWSFRMASMVIALTKTEEKILIKKFYVNADRIKVIPNGVEIPNGVKLLGLSGKKRILKKYGIKSNLKTVITIGRIAKNKGQIFLVKAVFKLKNVNLIIVGKNWGEKENLVKYTRDNNIKNVHFLEGLSDNEKNELLSASDVFVLSSIAGESFGIVLLEAMSYGLPIIVSDIGGIKDIVENGKNGYLVKPGNINDLEGKIKLLLRDEKINNMRKFCFDFVSNFDWDTIYLRTKKLYTSF